MGARACRAVIFIRLSQKCKANRQKPGLVFIHVLVKLHQCFVLNLSDSLACQAQFGGNLLQGEGLVAVEPVMHGQYSGFARGDLVEQRESFGLLFMRNQLILGFARIVTSQSGLEGLVLLGVIDLAAVLYGTEYLDGLMYDSGLSKRQAHYIGHFLNIRLSAQLVLELSGGVTPSIHQPNHIAGHMDGSYIRQKRAFDTLLYPPGSISAESGPTVRVKIIDRPDKPEVAFLNEVSNTHTSVGVSLGYADHEAQITAHKLLSCDRVVLFNDQFSEISLFGGGQQRRLIYFLEVVFYGYVKSYGSLPPSRKVSRPQQQGPQEQSTVFTAMEKESSAGG